MKQDCGLNINMGQPIVTLDPDTRKTTRMFTFTSNDDLLRDQNCMTCSFNLVFKSSRDKQPESVDDVKKIKF